MKIIFGILFLLLGIIGGIYVSLWLCLVGGLIQAIHAFQATPLDAVHLAYGIVRVMLTGFFGWLTFIICALIGAVFFAWEDSGSRRRSW